MKVVLGLLEIGFAFKFLSNADLVLQLGLLKRELFIAIWIAVALCIAVYLYGGLRFPHDSKLERMSVGRWSLGTVFLVLAIYMMPGMWGAPLNLISGFPPPMFYAESSGSVGAGGHGAGQAASGHVEARFRDYEEGLAAAKAEGKPMILDFTGWACVNCRKMEEQVWPHPEVVKYLTEEAVLVSLYVDERKALPEAEQAAPVCHHRDRRGRCPGLRGSQRCRCVARRRGCPPSAGWRRTGGTRPAGRRSPTPTRRRQLTGCGRVFEERDHALQLDLLQHLDAEARCKLEATQPHQPAWVR